MLSKKRTDNYNYVPINVSNFESLLRGILIPCEQERDIKRTNKT